MQNPDPIAVDPRVARNQLAALFRPGGAAPDRRVEDAARAKLATSKIDKAIRDAVAACPAPLHPAQVEYLVGLIQDAGKPRSDSEA